MNLKTFFTLNAVMFIPFGVGMLLVPLFIFGMVDVNLNDDGLLIASTVGSMLLSFGLTCLISRNATGNSIPLQALLVGNFCFHTIDSMLTFQASFNQVMNNLGYMFSAMHFLFAIGFIFYYFDVKKTAVSRS